MQTLSKLSQLLTENSLRILMQILAKLSQVLTENSLRILMQILPKLSQVLTENFPGELWLQSFSRILAGVS
jgi:hypothetical protein